MIRWACCLGLICAAAGCASVQPQAPVQAVRPSAEGTSGVASPPPAAGGGTIRSLLAAPPVAQTAPAAPDRSTPTVPGAAPRGRLQANDRKLADAPAPPARRRIASAARGHETPMPYSACPKLTLSYCLGQIGPGLDNPEDVLSPEQAKRLQRCELDIGDKAIAFFAAGIAGPPADADILGDHCATGFLKTRSVQAARDRLPP